MPDVQQDCLQSLLKVEIAFLKSELKLIPAMKTSIEALHREVSDLQSKTNISATASGDSAAVTVPTYARVASNRNVLHQKQQPHSHRKHVADKPVNASSANTTGSDNRNHNHAKQECVAVLHGCEENLGDTKAHIYYFSVFHTKQTYHLRELFNCEKES